MSSQTLILICKSISIFISESLDTYKIIFQQFCNLISFYELTSKIYCIFNVYNILLCRHIKVKLIGHAYDIIENNLLILYGIEYNFIIKIKQLQKVSSVIRKQIISRYKKCMNLSIADRLYCFMMIYKYHELLRLNCINTTNRDICLRIKLLFMFTFPVLRP